MAAPTPSASLATPDTARSYIGPMAIMTTLYFLWGGVTNFNGILIPYLNRACQLTDFQSAFVDSAFFGAYFLMSLPAGAILRRTGYQRGIVLGLLIFAAGALLFIPAANTRTYGMFLLALGVLGAGVTLLQVACNPYVSVLGAPEKAASRVSIVGTANGLAGTIAPYLGGKLLLSGAVFTASQIAVMTLAERNAYLDEQASFVKAPYAILAVVLVALAGLVWMAKMPNIDSLQADESEATAAAGNRTSALQYPHLVLGILAIFFYVGMEVGIGSFLIRYGHGLGLPNFTDEKGSVYVAYYWGSFTVGRLIGIPVLSRVRDTLALRVVCLAGLMLLAGSYFFTGYVALWMLVLCGICNSIMWPVIFPMAIKGLGVHTKQGASFLIMAIVGGALIPPLMGFISTYLQPQLGDASIRAAFFVPALCYAYLLYYALSGYRVR